MACRDCISGSLHEGTPTGREESLYGLSTYIAEPPSDEPHKGIIVIIPDGLGWTFNNSRLHADKLAIKTKSIVYLPDFMAGNSMSPSVISSMDALMGNGWMVGKILPFAHALTCMIPFSILNRVAVAQPRINKFFQDLQADNISGLPVGAAGYCWGGKFVFLLCSDFEKAAGGKSLINCGFAAHPSSLVIPNDAEDVALPLSVIVGDVDMVLPIAKAQSMKEILEKKEKDKHEAIIIPGAKHGFAIRGHPDDEKAAEQGRQAENQAVNWFNKHFEKVLL